MELGWSSVGAGGNVQILAERMQSIGDNYNSQCDNHTTFTELCRVALLISEKYIHCIRNAGASQHCSPSFPFIDPENDIHIQEARVCKRASLASVVLLGNLLSISACLTQIHFYPREVAKENHAFIYSNHWCLFHAKRWVKR